MRKLLLIPILLIVLIPFRSNCQEKVIMLSPYVTVLSGGDSLLGYKISKMPITDTNKIVCIISVQDSLNWGSPIRNEIMNALFNPVKYDTVYESDFYKCDSIGYTEMEGW